MTATAIFAAAAAAAANVVGPPLFNIRVTSISLSLLGRAVSCEDGKAFATFFLCDTSKTVN